ncbi:MAG TPA: potassium-transporting ATPase subunit KdpA [Chthoniobacteraceae bacterium]|nr:potassium-transporting ATPase subunit KdpA [Chthoniobacteraceae bacterium]
MRNSDWLQVFLYFAGLVALTPLLGAFMHRVFSGERNFLSPVLGPIEQLGYKLGGVDAKREMRWTHYTLALLAFNLLGFLVVLGLQLFQKALPLNPQGIDNVPFALALNTAVSFMTNTNWQAYSGESMMSYLTQMGGLAVQNFVSAATGIAVVIALARGLTRRSGESIGNFWADLVRSTLYVLLPVSLVFAVVLVQQGVPQTFGPYKTVKTLEPYKVTVPKLDSSGQPVKDAQGNAVTEEQTATEQVIPLGPAASQIAIKQLGTNGGGFYGANSAHPFENPTPLTNFLEMFTILMLSAALTYTYGLMTGDRRQGWTIFGAMIALSIVGFSLSWWAESQPNPATGLALNMEGKETRFGVMNSVLWSTATTDASNGSVNAMHDSLTPIAGGVAMFNIMLGEVIFGGVGAGLYGMLVFVILTVFIAGLMVGRTPEYLGKKIEAREVKWAAVAALAPCVCILVGTAIACLVPAGSATINNQGAHGFSEILYAFSSAAGNNGSAFAGIGVNTNFYNYALALAMFIGRFAIIVPVLAIAGSMVSKKIAPPSPGTFPTTGLTFVGLLIAVVLIVGGLNFFPALSLGPVVDHLLMNAGRTL